MPGLTDAGVVTRMTVTVSDQAAAQVVDVARALAVFLTPSDPLALTLADALKTLAVTLGAADPLPITEVDDPLALAFVLVSDLAAAVLVDVGSAQVATGFLSMTASDSTAVGTTDQASPQITTLATDTLAAEMVDAVLGLRVTVFTTDTFSVVFDSPTPLPPGLTLTASDACSVRLTDTALASVIGPSVVVLGVDAASVKVTDVAQVSQLAEGDYAKVTLVETGRVNITVIGADQAALTATDTGVRVITKQSIDPTDAAALTLIDAGQVLVTKDSPVAADTATLTVLDEVRALLVRLQVSDPAVLQLVDEAFVLLRVAGSDLDAVTLLDTAVAIVGDLVSIQGTDAASPALLDAGALTFLTLEASDDAGPALLETAVAVPTGAENITATDAVAVTALEAAAAAVLSDSIQAVDEVALALLEETLREIVYYSPEASDACPVLLDDHFQAGLFATAGAVEAVALALEEFAQHVVDTGLVELFAFDDAPWALVDEGASSIIQIVFDIDVDDACSVNVLDQVTQGVVVTLVAAAFDGLDLKIDDVGQAEVVLNRLGLVLVALADYLSGTRTLERVP